MTDEINKSFRYNGAMEGNRYQNEYQRKTKPEQRLGMTRRNFLAGAGNALVTVGLAKVAFDHYSAATPESVVSTIQVPPEALAPETSAEQVEQALTSEQFEAQTNAYRTQYAMEHEILFVDGEGRAIGTQPIAPIDGIAPGASYDATLQIVTEGFGGDWLAAAKTKVLEKYPDIDPETVEPRTNWNELAQAVSNQDEAMTYETVHSIADIVRYFGDKEVRGGGGLSRIEYVREAIEFQGNLAKAPLVVSELRRLMPGLCALESKFNDDVESGVGARGIFQFMPDTWEKELGRPAFVDGVSVPLTEQVEAAGELFSKMYDRLQYWCYEGENYYGHNYLEEIKAAFASQEDFETYFFVPCLVNAYNTGEQGMGEVVVAFAQSASFRKLKEAGNVRGYDLFQAMCDFARDSELSQLADYKEEAPQYVQRVFAFAELLQEGAGATRVAEL